jgi:phosphatidylserine/phosphatidylglycerophosphate/cardiolipin synthase-like enzyme
VDVEYGVVSPLALLVSYDETIAALERDLDALAAGDRASLDFYLLELGASTDRILGALSRAAQRGARVALSVDATMASRLSRLWEGTGTLLPSALALAAAQPDRFRVIARHVPDHSKVAIFRPRAGTPSALFGGINLGDRFRSWRDCMVRVEGSTLVDDLVARRRGEAASASSTATFVVNAPEASVFEIWKAFLALVNDHRLVRFRVAMAYLDLAGVEVLRRVLARGASLDLILPARANVYHDANMRALASLMTAGPVRALGCRDMMHAKILLAWDAAGAATTFLGSANLKRNSFRTFGELNILTTDRELTAAVERIMDSIASASDPILTPRYRSTVAAIEERLG